MQRAALWLPPAAYMLVIFVFSSQSQPLPAVTEHVWDKALHFLEYAGLGVLLYRAFRGEGFASFPAIAAAAAVACAYGASDEWHQSFVPLRDADVRDWLADVIGGSAGATVLSLLERSNREPGALEPDASSPSHRPRRLRR